MSTWDLVCMTDHRPGGVAPGGYLSRGYATREDAVAASATWLKTGRHAVKLVEVPSAPLTVEEFAERVAAFWDTVKWGSPKAFADALRDFASGKRPIPDAHESHDSGSKDANA